MREELDCEFVRINPSKEHFNINIELGKIHNHIIESTRKLTEESTKKSLIDELSDKLLGLKFESK